VLLAVILLMMIIRIPQWQAAGWQGLMEPKDLAKLENDARTTLIQGLGGLVLLVGLYFMLKNLQLTQDRQITERCTLPLSSWRAMSLRSAWGRSMPWSGSPETRNGITGRF
jgi:hypothetical protein